MITVNLDSGARQVPQGTTVAELLAQVLADTPTLRPEGVATAVNGDFVARHLRANHVLNDGDTLLCFAPITGG